MGQQILNCHSKHTVPTNLIYIYTHLHFSNVPNSSEDTAANIIRFARAIEEEFPHLLGGVYQLAEADFHHAEQRLHRVIRQWRMTIPLELYYFNKGFAFVPMVRATTWLEYLIDRRSPLILGGYDRKHPACAANLEAFWKAFRLEEPNHEVFKQHGDCLRRCVPLCLYSGEGRGLRKAPVQVTALRAVLGTGSFSAFEKLQHETWSDELFWRTQQHAGKGSSLLTHFLLYVLPHSMYRGRLQSLWYDVMAQVGRDLALAFNAGVSCQGEDWFFILVGITGDAPALAKVGRFNRAYNRTLGTSGICHACLGGQPNIPWESMEADAAWRGTLYRERPWAASTPSCMAPVPYDMSCPERAFRSDPMHLIKLGIARHYLASSIACLTEWSVFPGRSVDRLKRLEQAHADFVWACRQELRQTPHLKSFSKDLFHWPRLQSFPWGGCYAGLVTFFRCVFFCGQHNPKFNFTS